MFFEDRLSTLPVPSKYTGAGANPNISRIRDFEDGPVDFQDTSEGADFQLWESFNRDCQIFLNAPSLGDIPFFPNPYNLVTDFSFCFNLNADVHYVYTEQGNTFWVWYSTLSAKTSVMLLPEDTATARCTLDDKRAHQSGVADIILSYISKAGALIFRKQRERFGIERTLDAGPYVSLEKIYMNTGYRLQWDCVVASTPLPTVEPTLKTYARFVLEPVYTEEYVGLRHGVFDTGYAVPTNQKIDNTPSELISLYWEPVGAGARVVAEFSANISPDTKPHIWVLLKGLRIKLHRMSPTEYAGTIDQAGTLFKREGRIINVVLDYPEAINVTQEF